MTYAQIKALIANPCEKRYYDKRYCVGNEYGILAFVFANNEEDALDEAVNRDKLDCMLMSAEDFAEYEANGWDDSYIFLGDAGEPFWAEYLWIQEV